MSNATDEKKGGMKARHVFRLDAMSESELIDLKQRSGFLLIVAILFLFFLPLELFASYVVFGIWGGIWAVLGLAIPYAYKYARTPWARVYFYVTSILALVSAFPLFIGACEVLGIKRRSIEFFVAWGLWVGYWWFWCEVLKSARTPALWGREHFTHTQIVAAQTKRSKNENFTDEELPKGHDNPALAAICIFIAYLFVVVRLIGLASLVLGIIVNVLEGDVGMGIGIGVMVVLALALGIIGSIHNYMCRH